MISTCYWDLGGSGHIPKKRAGWYGKSSVLFGDSFFIFFHVLLYILSILVSDTGNVKRFLRGFLVWVCLLSHTVCTFRPQNRVNALESGIPLPVPCEGTYALRHSHVCVYLHTCVQALCTHPRPHIHMYGHLRPHMCVHTPVCTRVCTPMTTHSHVHMHACMLICSHVSLHTHVPAHVRTYLSARVCVCMITHSHVCMYACILICSHVSLHAHVCARA